MLTFPLSRTDFADGLRILSCDFDLTENRRTTETGGGELLISDLGPRLWSGTITVSEFTHAGQRRSQALVQALRQFGASFMIGDPKGRYPAADQDGSKLGSATPTLSTPVAGSSDISLAGLPVGYVLTPGDYIGFEYGTDPVRNALHQVIVADAPAAADGTMTVSVVPPIRPGASDGAEVILVGASCKAVVIPGSFKAGTIGLASTSGFSFSWRQVLK